MDDARETVEGFPVLLNEKQRTAHSICPESVPWDMIAPHEKRALKNHRADLDELCAAGGLDPVEIVCVLDNREFPHKDADENPTALLAKAVGELLRRVAIWMNAHTHPDAVLAPGFVWECVVCRTANAVPAHLSPARVQCSFCKVVHEVVPEDRPEVREDEPTPHGADDSAHAHGLHSLDSATPGGFVSLTPAPGSGPASPAAGAPEAA